MPPTCQASQYSSHFFGRFAPIRPEGMHRAGTWDLGLGTKRYKKTKNPPATAEEPGVKTGYREQKWGATQALCTQHHQGGQADHLSHPSSLTSDPIPTLTPCKGRAAPPIREQAREPVVLTPSCYSRGPVKPGLDFLSGLLSISIDYGGQEPWSGTGRAGVEEQASCGCPATSQRLGLSGGCSWS